MWDAAKTVELLELVYPIQTLVSTMYGAVDVREYDGLAKVVWSVSMGPQTAGRTVTGYVQVSEDGLTGWTDAVVFDAVASTAGTVFQRAEKMLNFQAVSGGWVRGRTVLSSPNPTAYVTMYAAAVRQVRS